jgi:zinc transport system ATP-binding protein
MEVKDLSISYQTNRVLDNISFSIEKGDYIGIVGPNGAGKTSLIKALTGLLSPDKGEIINHTRKIGYLQQKISLNDARFPANVEEIIKSGLLINKRFLKFYNSKDKAALENVISLLDIESLRRKLIGKLSGGQLQKVLLARALINQPDILFLDEPATALDPVSRTNFYDTMKILNEKSKTAIVIVSHDMGSMGKYAKKLLYIDRKMIFFGTFEEFCQSSDMTEYFGELSQHIFCRRHE